MALSSRVFTRVLVIGAVVALTGSLSALPVAGEDATGQDAASQEAARQRARADRARA